MALMGNFFQSTYSELYFQFADTFIISFKKILFLCVKP